MFEPFSRSAFSLLQLAAAVLLGSAGRARAAPNPGENVPFLITFGAQADPSWGDDDFSPTFFFPVPKESRKPVYIRVFDPDCGGRHDEPKHGWNTSTSFSLYGGAGAHSAPDARATTPKGQYRAGTALAQKTFGNEPTYKNRWDTFGPLNPLEGKLPPESDGYGFKLIARGLRGDDGTSAATSSAPRPPS